MDQNFNISSRVIDHSRYIPTWSLYPDFTQFSSFNNRVDKLRCGDAKGHIPNSECFLIQFFNTRPNPNLAPTLTIVVVAHVDEASCLEIRKERHRLIFQNLNGRFNQFIEIMGKNFGRKPYGNSFNSLRQQQRKLDG